MEFCYVNYLNTSTQLSVSNNTGGAYNVISFDETRQWVTDGDNDDTTVTSMTISFDATTSISRLFLRSINWKDFTIFYNGATANTFSLDSNQATTTSDFSSNSDTSMVLMFSAVDVTSLTFDISSTIVSNSEKTVGNIYVTDQRLNFARLPDSSGYKPSERSVEIIHTLSDGGKRITFKAEKHEIDINLKYISTSFRNDLRTLWREKNEFLFVAFPTSTEWDEFCFPCVWEGPFDFFKLSNNNPNAGFNGTIRLSEVPQ